MGYYIYLTQNIRLWFVTIVTMFVGLSYSHSQEKPICVEYIGDSPAKNKIKEKVFDNQKEASQYIDKQIFRLQKRGFLLAKKEIDSLEETCWKYRIELGPKTNLLKIELSDSLINSLQLIDYYDEKLFRSFPLRASVISRIFTDILERFNDQGFPFAKVDLSIDFENELPRGSLQIIPGPYLTWAEIEIKSSEDIISNKYLQSLLEIREGQAYSESSFKKIERRIGQLSFLKLSKAPEILFTQEQVEVFLYLEPKKTNALNGFIGLQPRANNEGYAVNGDIDLRLQNSLKKGELLALKWRNLQGESQQLKSKLDYPFLFGSKFGIGGNFNLYKRDSTFLELKSTAKVNYRLGNGSQIYFFFERLNSNQLRSSASSSFLGSVFSNNYGLGWENSRLDYIPNPRSGFQIDIYASLGSRRSQENDSSIVLRTTRIMTSLDLSYYQWLGGRHVLKYTLEGRYIQAPELYLNELDRFGGLLNQRGFNEDEFFASSRAMFSLEYRLLLDENSRIFAFYDQSGYENLSLNRRDWPFGFGAGLAFGTDIGTFSILYALGSQQGNPILIQDGKIHFGYVAFF